MQEKRLRFSSYQGSGGGFLLVGFGKKSNYLLVAASVSRAHVASSHTNPPFGGCGCERAWLHARNTCAHARPREGAWEKEVKLKENGGRKWENVRKVGLSRSYMQT